MADNSRHHACCRLIVLFLMAATLAAMPAMAATPKVVTVAGGYRGDGKPATSAALSHPGYVARDSKGNIFISDGGNCRIRKVNTKGIISTAVGTGLCGFSGDGGSAKLAQIFAPAGMALDASGSLFFVDNLRVRKVAAGIITTVAGNGVFGYSGDGGPATQASLGNPRGISVDSSGNLYIADSSNYVIRMVDSGGIIHTVAGDNTYGYSGDGGPATVAQLVSVSDVVADGRAGFYIADGAHVRKVDAAGIITTYAGNGNAGNTGSGGPATQAALGNTNGLLLTNPHLYISTNENIWVVDLATQIINLIAGMPDGSSGFNGDGKSALSTSFAGTFGLALDRSGNLLVVDSGNNRVRKIGSDQMISTFAGGYIGDGGSALAAALNVGYFGGHIAFDQSGDLYIADSLNHRVRKVSPTGTISTIAGTGISENSGDGGAATQAGLNDPSAVAIDAFGNIFVAEWAGQSAIRKVDTAGIITTFLSEYPGQGPAYANGLALDGEGNLYASAGLDGVWKITPDGSATRLAGNFCFGYNGDNIPALQACIYPAGIALDKVGNFYFADFFNYRVRKVDANGIITTVAGGGSDLNGDGGPATQARLFQPLDVTFDSKGNLYIADSGRVRVVDGAGIINTFAGTGIVGYNGNGLPATQTNILPLALTMSPKGIFYAIDGGSGRVRKVH